MIGKAAITDGKGNFIIDEITVGDPKPDEVLVQIKAAGICHTDYDSLKWGKTLILGHEGSGEVIATGKDVTKFQQGDKVLLNWAIPCGYCFQCHLGNQHICENNSPVTGNQNNNNGHAHAEGTTFHDRPIQRSFNLGTLSNYTLVKEKAVTKIGNNIPYSSASILGCGVMTGYGSVVNAAKVSKGSTVAVLGSGGVGLNVIQAARISGATEIIAMDINHNRLGMSKKFGSTHQILVNPHNGGMDHAIEEVKALTKGRGVDYAFECTGNPKLGAVPLALARNAGMAVQVSGIEEEIIFDMNLFEWDKIYINPLYGQCTPDKDFPHLLDLYDKGELLLDEMISKSYELANLDQAFDDMLNGKIAKGVVTF